MRGSSIIILLVVVTMVAQVAWARCICDPADTLCLDSCVNSARDCIEGCDGKSGDSCFTTCVNVHWPGATFEDAGIVDPVTSQITSKRPKITPTTNHMVSFPTTTNAVGPLPTAATATAGPADDLIPFLMSIFGGLSGPSSSAVAALPSALPSGLPSAISSALTLDNSGILNVSSFTSQFPISSSIPSFTTTHTTVTSLVTVTPNPISVSATNNNNTSHGIKNLVDPWTVIITFFFFLFTTFSLV